MLIYYAIMPKKEYQFEIRVFRPEYSLSFDTYEEDFKNLEKTNPFTIGDIIIDSKVVGKKEGSYFSKECFSTRIFNDKVVQGHCNVSNTLKGKVYANSLLEAIKYIVNDNKNIKFDYLNISYEDINSEYQLIWNKGILDWKNFSKQKFLQVDSNSLAYKTIDKIIN